ncbi:MAG: hypothetical protein GWN40_11220 [Nitrosopumilaceae archaeon]|nr:hypothetical protein [Nitrosopumilaceae archaeon]
MPFANWIELADEDLNAVKKKDLYILDGILNYAKNKLYREKIKIFGLSENEISLYRTMTDIAINEWKYTSTNKPIYNSRAKRDKAKIHDLNNRKKYALGDYSKYIYNNTGKTYKLNEMSVFEVLTILNTINEKIKLSKRNANKK